MRSTSICRPKARRCSRRSKGEAFGRSIPAQLLAQEREARGFKQRIARQVVLDVHETEKALIRLMGSDTVDGEHELHGKILFVAQCEVRHSHGPDSDLALFGDRQYLIREPCRVSVAGYARVADGQLRQKNDRGRALEKPFDELELLGGGSGVAEPGLDESEMLVCNELVLIYREHVAISVASGREIAGKKFVTPRSM